MSSSSKSIVRIVEFTSFEANEDGIVECDALTALANDHDGHDAATSEHEALKMGGADARERADAAAAGAGMKVERVLKIEEQRSIGDGPRPMMMTMATAAQEARTTPASPGEIEIRSIVTLTTAVR